MKLFKHLTYITTFAAIILFIGIHTKMLKPNSSGTVIILNGPSSAGKSSIIKALQSMSSDIWLSIGIDNFFCGVLPSKFYLEDKPEHHAIMHGTASEDNDGKLFTLTIGSEGQKVIKGMHRAIAAYAHSGNNVIVDYIKYDDAWIPDLKNSLHEIKVIWIGVTAPLEILKEREKKRGTSPEGHARSHHNTVHDGMTYDLILETESLTPDECANKIISFVQQSTH